MSVALLMLVISKVVGGSAISKMADFRADEEHLRLNYFRNLTEIYAYLDFIEEKFPAKCEIEIFGRTFLKNDLKVLKICHDKVCGKKPIIYIQGGIHAREWLSPATILYLISKLTTDIDQQDQEIISGFDFFIVPVLNPDGYAFSHTTKSSRMWRKNRRVYPTKDYFFHKCVGVDLNRNFGTKFWNKSSRDSCDSNYGGPYPYSEQESFSLKTFLEPYKQKIVFFVDIHTYSQMILLPWGYLTEKTAKYLHRKEYSELMRFIAFPTYEMMKVHRKFYVVGHTHTLLYEVYGDVSSWAHDYLGIKYSYAMELRPKSRGVQSGFLIGEEEIIPTGEEVWAFHHTVLTQIDTRFSNDTVDSEDIWSSFRTTHYIPEYETSFASLQSIHFFTSFSCLFTLMLTLV